jgi:hypothetical protein
MAKMPKCMPLHSTAYSFYLKNTVLPATHCFQNRYLHFTDECILRFCCVYNSMYYRLQQIINTTDSSLAFVCILLEAHASGLLSSSSSTSLHPSLFVLIGCKYMENTTSYYLTSLQQAELFSARQLCSFVPFFACCLFDCLEPTALKLKRAFIRLRRRIIKDGNKRTAIL